MRTQLLLALGFVALPATATAHSANATVTHDVVTSVSPVPDSARMRAMLARADEASFAGRLGEAKRLYRSLIDEQRDADQFAPLPLWRLATTHFYGDDRRGAALVLDELARDAARYGDPGTELRATFEAAVLWRQLKQHDVAAERIERVQCLLQSPVIPEAEKASFRGRMIEG